MRRTSILLTGVILVMAGCQAPAPQPTQREPEPPPPPQSAAEEYAYQLRQYSKPGLAGQTFRSSIFTGAYKTSEACLSDGAILTEYRFDASGGRTDPRRRLWFYFVDDRLVEWNTDRQDWKANPQLLTMWGRFDKDGKPIKLGS